MKEDVLEQIVDDWLLSQKGTFTKHNVKFRPDSDRDDYNSKTDSSYSDIDILAIHTHGVSNQKVSVVSCKSWQHGFSPKNWSNILTLHPCNKAGGREAWKFFRELVIPKWTEAFVQKIEEETNQTEFIYYIACTKIEGEDNRKYFEENKKLLNNLKDAGVKRPLIKIITFEEIFSDYFKRSNKQTLEATEIGRLLQLIKASKVLDNIKI